MAVSLTETVTLPPVDSLHDRFKSQSTSSVAFRSTTSSRTPRNGVKTGPIAAPNSVRIDPHKALLPARKKLSTLEAQRVMAVLAAAIRRAELATLLPRLAAVQRASGEQNIAFGSELSRLIESNGVVISSYNELNGVLPIDDVKSDGRRSTTSVTDSVRANSALRASSAVSRGESAVSRPPTGSAIEPSASLKSQSRQSVLEEDEQSAREPTPARELIAQTPVSVRSQKDAVVGVDVWSTDDSSRRSQRDAAVVKNLALVEVAMRDLCRNVLRSFVLNPSAADAALSNTPGRVRSQAADEVIRQLKALRDFLMSRLLTTPVEDVEKSRFLREIGEKEKYNAGIVAKLAAELQIVEEQRDVEISSQNEIIRRLQSELHQIERTAEEAVRRTRADAERQEAADKKNSDGKMGKLQHDLGQVRAQYASLLAEHRESEQALRKRKFQVETEIENWIQKYDGDMGERQDELEQIDAVYTEEKRQLNELEERFRALEVEYRRIMDERRAARETREAAERELQMCVRAALTIQAFWRSFKVRKAIKAKKKRGGGAGRVAATGGGQKKVKK